VQLAGEWSNDPYSVEITGPDGTLFRDAKFLRDYRSRDLNFCGPLAKKVSASLAPELVPVQEELTTVSELPGSFVESHLPTKTTYLASLKLGDVERFKMENDALEAKRSNAPRTPTASISSSTSSRAAWRAAMAEADDCCDSNECC